MNAYAKRRLEKKLAEINRAIGDEGIILPPSETAFNKYKAAVKQLLVDFLGSDIELLYFEWDAADQAFTLQVEHWNRTTPDSLPLAARYNTSWSPPRWALDDDAYDNTRAGGVADVCFSKLFEEIDRWRSKIEVMFRAARQVERTPDLSPLPEKR